MAFPRSKRQTPRDALQTDIFQAAMSLFAIFLIAAPCYATAMLPRQPRRTKSIGT
jgi:hypothetical protein